MAELTAYYEQIRPRLYACDEARRALRLTFHDAFQWTSLEPLLRGLDVRELVVCGVVTNLCVETTVRSAFMRDFPVTVLADCCAAKTHRLHELSVEVLTSYELAEVASISDGYDVGLDRAPVSV